MRRYLALLVAALAVAAAVVLPLAIDDGEDGPSTVTVTVNDRPGDRVPEAEVTVPEPVLEQATRVTESDLRHPSPVAQAVAPEQIQEAAEQQQRIRETQDPLPVAGASQGVRGCVTRFVRNQSSRAGVRPQQHWLHYTVSQNRPGWSDVNAIVAFFDQSSSQASSHFVIDREGNCAYTVPIERNSWTQAAANRIAVSYEIINSGSEGSFMDSAGYAKLRAVMRIVSQRTGIPMRRGRVEGCRAAVPGIVHHKDGGVCAGGHVDITPYSIDQVVKIVTAGGSTAATAQDLAVLTKGERAAAECLIRERGHRKRSNAPIHRRRSRECKAQLHRYNERIHGAAKETGWDRLNRRARHRVIHQVI
jgi:hypothetical protein